MRRPACLLLTAALVTAGLVQLPAQPASATLQSDLERINQLVLTNVLTDTRSPDLARATAARTSFSRSLESAAPKAASKLLGTVALGYVAAEIWHHNVMTIRAGQASDPIRMKAQWAPSTAGLSVDGYLSASRGGDLSTTVALTSFEYKVVRGSDGRLKGQLTTRGLRQMTAFYKVYCSGAPEGYTCWRYSQGDVVGLNDWQGLPQYILKDATTVEFDPVTSTVGGVVVSNPYTLKGYDRLTDGYLHLAYSRDYEVCVTEGCTAAGNFPVFDMGTAEPTSDAPAASDTEITPQEAADMVADMRQRPEWDPAWERPWLRPEWRMPQALAEREAIFGAGGAVVSGPLPNTTCQAFQNGATVCDSPEGEVFYQPEPATPWRIMNVAGTTAVTDRVAALINGFEPRKKGAETTVPALTYSHQRRVFEECERVIPAALPDPCESEALLVVGIDAQEAAKHNLHALAEHNPAWVRLHYRPKDSNPLSRDEKLNLDGCAAGKDPTDTETQHCDEYPFRATLENDLTMSTAFIRADHNMKEGSVYGNLVVACGHNAAWEANNSDNRPFIVLNLPADDAPPSFYVCGKATT